MGRHCFFLLVVTVITAVFCTCEAYIFNPPAIVQPRNDCKHCVCGIGFQARIINGDEASYAEFPWAVRIIYNNTHHGGGSMITARHVLTASHVFFDFKGKKPLSENLFEFYPADGFAYKIGVLTLHSNYEHGTFKNDIAIVKLDRPVALDGAVKTICLPKSPMSHYNGGNGVAFGWGRISEYNLTLSTEMRKLYMPILSEEECQYSGYPENRITDEMFCAGYFDGSRDTCGGDSGGPLQVRSDSGAMEVVGIISFGRGCAKPNYPGVYTKVTKYLGWIAQNLNNECLCSPPY